jgi:hypothetical protein
MAGYLPRPHRGKVAGFAGVVVDYYIVADLAASSDIFDSARMRNMARSANAALMLLSIASRVSCFD